MNNRHLTVLVILSQALTGAVEKSLSTSHTKIMTVPYIMFQCSFFVLGSAGISNEADRVSVVAVAE